MPGEIASAKSVAPKRKVDKFLQDAFGKKRETPERCAVGLRPSCYKITRLALWRSPASFVIRRIARAIQDEQIRNFAAWALRIKPALKPASKVFCCFFLGKPQPASLRKLQQSQLPQSL